MKRRPSKNQTGFALLFFVLAIMGAGGLLLVGFSEGMLDAAESKKFEHNERVLKEAKQALLQSAYNYPVTNGEGPGRLPCADTDNDGIANCGSTFGRLPWAQPNLNLYDIRDADGQRLWYAVSSSFRPQAGIINSDTSGTITLRDQLGNMIYDGSNPAGLTQYGIAAVIIAPGAAIVRNDGVIQDRTVANVNATEHYLDDTDDEDNASFINTTTNGFILGPVPDLTNDQFIVITAAEVAEVAEKAAMQAYRTAIEDYRVNTSYCEGEVPDGATTEADCLAAPPLTTAGTWTLGPYPWLFNYKVIPNYAGLTSYYPADPTLNCSGENNPEKTDEAACVLDGGDWGVGSLAPSTGAQTIHGNIGRIPTIFGDYFTETGGAPIKLESEINGSVAITYPAGLDWDDGKSTGKFDFNDGFAPPFYSNGVSTDVEFVDITDTVGSDGRLTATFAVAEPLDTLHLYFWDDDDYPTDVWTSCPDDGDGVPEMSDCHRVTCSPWVAGCSDPIPGASTTQHKLYILHIEVALDWATTPGTQNFDLDYTPHCEYEQPDGATTEAGCLSATTPGKWFPNIEIVPATADSHAMIQATFHASHVINGMPALSGTATFEWCPHYHVGDDPSDFAGCVDKDGEVELADFSLDELTLATRYYPEIPDWAFDNDWHNSMILHYAWDYRPGGDQVCDPTVFDLRRSCIFIRERDFSATEPWNRDKVAILLNTAEHDWVDGAGLDGTGDSPGDATFLNDKEDWDRVVDDGNRELDYIMRWKDPGDPDSGTPWEVPPGNDNFLILEELP